MKGSLILIDGGVGGVKRLVRGTNVDGYIGGMKGSLDGLIGSVKGSWRGAGGEDRVECSSEKH